MLLRVRDEFRMFKLALQSLYDSSIAYGLKKALIGEQEKEVMKNKQLQLEKDNRELTYQIEELEQTICQREERIADEMLIFNEDLDKDKKVLRIRVFKLQEALSTLLERTIPV